MAVLVIRALLSGVHIRALVFGSSHLGRAGRSQLPKSAADSKKLEYGFGPLPKGSRYLVIKELGLKDHDNYGFWGLSP